MKIVIIGFALMAMTSAFLRAEEKDIPVYLEMVARGQSDEVRKALPDMLAKNPHDPGVQLLHASLLHDAETAIKMYEKIVEDYPQSKWADDADWRIIQYYAVLGDVFRAQAELKKFKERYPVSEFLVSAYELVRICETIHGGSFLAKDKNPAGRNEINSVKKEDVPDIATIPATDLKIEKKAIPVPSAKVEKKFEVKAETVKAASTKSEASKVEPAKPEAAKNITPPKNTSDQRQRFGLQVASFKSKAGAQNAQTVLLQKRLKTVIIEKKFKGDIIYAVVVGDYSTKERAEVNRETVKNQCNCEPIITEK